MSISDVMDLAKMACISPMWTEPMSTRLTVESEFVLLHRVGHETEEKIRCIGIRS